MNYSFKYDISRSEQTKIETVGRNCGKGRKGKTSGAEIIKKDIGLPEKRAEN